MNERLKELYKSCRPKEALASQEQFQSADVLLGTEVAKFAELIVRECLHIVDDEGAGEGGCIRAMIRIQEEFGVEE